MNMAPTVLPKWMLCQRDIAHDLLHEVRTYTKLIGERVFAEGCPWAYVLLVLIVCLETCWWQGRDTALETKQGDRLGDIAALTGELGVVQ